MTWVIVLTSLWLPNWMEGDLFYILRFFTGCKEGSHPLPPLGSLTSLSYTEPSPPKTNSQ
jgi:hypothetical protein